MNCPVRGHDHALVAVGTHTQHPTGQTGTTWECPSGRYRWFAIDGRPVSNVTRQVRPRYGWRT